MEFSGAADLFLLLSLNLVYFLFLLVLRLHKCLIYQRVTTINMELSGKNMDLSGVNMKFSGNEYGIFRRNNGVFRMGKRANPYKYGVFSNLESLGDIIKWLG